MGMLDEKLKLFAISTLTHILMAIQTESPPEGGDSVALTSQQAKVLKVE
ncbi:hypothetical protein [Vibrio mimicus]|nr:hypothetical protein [Vibrio mimicus]